MVNVKILPGKDVKHPGESQDIAMVQIETPKGSERTPSDICCIVDVSGSMGAEAMLKTETGDMSGHGLSVLDIVKHALKTIIRNLQAGGGKPGDRLALVAYSTDASTIFDLTEMTENGRSTSEQKLDELVPTGMTNLWDGLKTGFELLKRGHQPGRLQHIMLFTDGLPNINPPRGIPAMLKRMKDKEGGKLPCTISTFGFGYELDSELLSQLATDGSGSYNFIPDAGFVGTVFVNALANLLVTIGKDTRLTLETCNGATFAGPDPIVGGHHQIEKKDDKIVLSMGMLQYGQNKDMVVRLKLPASSQFEKKEYLKATLEYTSKDDQIETATASVAEKEGADAVVEPELLRLRFADVLRHISNMTKLSAVDKAQGKQLPLAEALEVARKFAEEVKGSREFANSEYIKGMYEDVVGQVSEALSREEWYSKWGVHYLPSLLFAHLMQQCNNFKDAGVQNFGGDLFNEVRDQADEVFLKLPPPTPSVRPAPPAPAAAAARPSVVAAPARAPAPQITMAAFHDRYGGCFSGDCLVLMADGTTRKVRDVRKGDKLASPGMGEASEVLCVARTRVDGGSLRLVELEGGLKITAYHPVQISGEWRFPLDVASEKEVACDAIFTFLLQEGGSVALVDGVPCVTLGHGLKQGAAEHPFFGNWQAVHKDLETLPGFHSGIVDLEPGSTRRDPETGLVNSLSGRCA